MSIADQLTTRVISLLPVRTARTVCCYVALGDEVPTRPILAWCWAEKKTVLVPHVTGPETMVPVRIRRWEELRPGSFGVLEPVNAQAFGGTIDVMVVPGRQFSITGDRQGRGRGYYDRFLAQYPQATRIGLAYESQIVEQLTTQSHDVPMTYVVTEQRTLGPFSH